MNNSILRNVVKHSLIVVSVAALLAAIVNIVQLLKTDFLTGDSLNTLYAISTVVAVIALVVGVLSLAGYVTSRQPGNFSILEYSVSIVALVGGVFLLLVATTPLIRTEVPKPDYSYRGPKYIDDFYSDISVIKDNISTCNVIVIEPAVSKINDEKYIRLALKTMVKFQASYGYGTTSELAAKIQDQGEILKSVDASYCDIAQQLGDEPAGLVSLNFEQQQYSQCNLANIEPVYKYEGTGRAVIKITTSKPVRLPGASSDMKEFIIDFSYRNYSTLKAQSSMYASKCPDGFLLSSLY